MNYETLMDAIDIGQASFRFHLRDAIEYSYKYKFNVLTFRELPWQDDSEKEIKYLVETLKKYDVKEFWISESSTALNKILIRLMANNVVITGGEVIEVASPYFSWTESIPVLKCKIGG